MANVRSGNRVLIAQKRLKNRLGNEQLIGQLVNLSAKALGKSLMNRGWAAKRPTITAVQDGNQCLFTGTVKFTRVRPRAFPEESLDKHFETISRKFFGGRKQHGWYPEAQVAGSEVVPIRPATGEEVEDFAGGSAIVIPNNWKDYYRDIYDRDDQILEVIESLRTAKQTDMRVRNHLLLFGPPGCGKTDSGLATANMLVKSFAAALGDPDLPPERAVVRLDATATTKAGAENLILELKPIPPVLIIEELEKVNEGNLPWLLGILDDRGEIIKTNARIGSVRRKAPMLVIATVNNIAKFESFQEGALADRFSVPLYFSMPDRTLLRRILLRELSKIPDGKEEWVDPALDYALQVEKTYKARRIKAIMTNARDRLLDSTYMESRKRMMDRRTQDKEKLEEFGVVGGA